MTTSTTNPAFSYFFILKIMKKKYHETKCNTIKKLYEKKSIMNSGVKYISQITFTKTRSKHDQNTIKTRKKSQQNNDTVLFLLIIFVHFHKLKT